MAEKKVSGGRERERESESGQHPASATPSVTKTPGDRQTDRQTSAGTVDRQPATQPA